MTEHGNTGMTCPITGCPVKKIIIGTVVVAVVTFLFDWIFHGMLLKPDYEATAALWRPEAEMQAMTTFCLIYHFVLAFGVSALYCYFAKSSECKGACPNKGMKFGFFIGLILGISHFASYIWMPIPLELAIKWLVGSIVWGVIVGYVLAMMCSKCKDTGSCSATK